MSNPKDGRGQEIAVGDTVITAKTGKSAGISLSEHVVARVTPATVFFMDGYRRRNGEEVTYESRCLAANCINLSAVRRDPTVANPRGWANG